METPLCLVALGECSLCPLYRPPDRSYPRTWRTATLAAKERTDVRQDGIGQVKYCLKWAESKDTEGEGPGKPLSAGQVPQDLRNGFSIELHGTVGIRRMHRRCLPVQERTPNYSASRPPRDRLQMLSARKILVKKPIVVSHCSAPYRPAMGHLLMTAVNPSGKRCESSRRKQCQSSIP